MLPIKMNLPGCSAAPGDFIHGRFDQNMALQGCELESILGQIWIPDWGLPEPGFVDTTVHNYIT